MSDAFATVRPSEPFALAKEPAALTALLRSPEVATREKVLRAMEHFIWPGAKPASTLTKNAPPLTPVQEKRVQAGQQLYTTVCAACHQPNGGGIAAVAPPLAGSDWVSGPPERLVRVVLHGLYGPIEVSGQKWNLNMPALGATGLFDDEKIAAVLSYIRRAWGNTAAPIEPEFVAAVRKETDGRTLPWRAEELTQVAEKADAPPALQPAANGELLLPASKATVFAQKLAYRPTLDVLAPWTIADDIAEWHVEVPAAGTYEVTVTLAADTNSAGDFYVIETEGSRTRGEVPDTGGYDTFKQQPAGRLTLRAGLNRILLHPDGPLKQELADVRGLRLVPIAKPQ